MRRLPNLQNRGSAGSQRSASARSTGARRSLVSQRTAVMVGVLVVSIIMLALPLREYLRQRGEINSAGDVTAEQRARVDALQAKVDLWNNDDYVHERARERLHFLLPGEVAYVVVRPGEENGIPSVPITGEQTQELPAGTWYVKLWGSVRQADQDPKDSRGGPFPEYDK